MTSLKLNLEKIVRNEANNWKEVENKKVFMLESGFNVYCSVEGRTLIPFAQYHFTENTRNGLKQNKISKGSMYMILDQLDQLEGIDRVQIRGYNKDLPARYITEAMLSENFKFSDIFDEKREQPRDEVGSDFYLQGL